METSSVVTASLGGSSAVPAIFKPLSFSMWVGDFDQSGRDDVVIRRGGKLARSVWNDQGRSQTQAGTADPTGRLATAFLGDFETRGRAEVIQYDDTDGSFWLGRLLDGAFGWQGVGNKGSAGITDALFPDAVRRPVWIGDFYGAGSDQLLMMYHDDWRLWSLTELLPGGTQLVSEFLGSTRGFGHVWDGRPFLQGDFTGAGYDQLIFYYPGDGNWWLGDFADNTGRWRLVGNTQGAHRDPPPVPPTCTPLADQLDGIAAEIEQLQDDLRHAAGSERASIIAQIRRLDQQEVHVRRDLQACVAQHGDPPPRPWPDFGPINGPIFSGRFTQAGRSSVGFWGNDRTIWLATIVDGELAWSQAAAPPPGEETEHALDVGPGYLGDFDGDGLDEIAIYDVHHTHWAVVDFPAGHATWRVQGTSPGPTNDGFDAEINHRWGVGHLTRTDCAQLLYYGPSDDAFNIGTFDGSSIRWSRGRWPR